MITDFRGEKVTKERKADDLTDHTLETLRKLIEDYCGVLILGVHPPTKYSR